MRINQTKSHRVIGTVTDTYNIDRRILGIDVGPEFGFTVDLSDSYGFVQFRFGINTQVDLGRGPVCVTSLSKGDQIKLLYPDEFLNYSAWKTHPSVFGLITYPKSLHDEVIGFR